MDYESICGSLQTISIARLFYEYGKLDRLLERGITISFAEALFSGVGLPSANMVPIRAIAASFASL